ncbi:MAG: DUF2905 domain-containing protein [Chloroflexi bacterium]|nr:DUF2905 domain-containing protein [Chloroflexota bacterium]
MSGLGGIGKWLMAAGVVILLLGGALWLLSKIPSLGRLPGDIRIERSGFTCLIPLVSSIFLSLSLTILLNVILQIARFFTRRGPP